LLGLAAPGAVRSSREAGPTRLAFETNRTGDGDIAVATDANGGQLVTSAGSEDIQPAVAPNGRIAFASDRDDNYDLFVTDAGGQGERTQITKNKASDYSPAWAPGGGLLAFVSERNGNADIFVIDASGSAVAESVTTSRADDRDPAWSPNGVKLVFSSDRSGTYDLWIIRFGHEPRRITSGTANDFEPAWSPDGRLLAFTRRDSTGNYDIFTLNLYTGNFHRVTRNPAEDSEPAWSRDGKQLAFTSDRGGDYDIYVIDVDGLGEVQNFSNDPAALFDVSPSWKPAEVAQPTRTTGSVKTPKGVIECDNNDYTDGADVIVGSPVDDHLCGGGGGDVIKGRGGNDVIYGDAGSDRILGQDGNDILVGGEGKDQLFGGAGKDKLKCRDGHADALKGGNGQDRGRTDGRRVDAEFSVEAPL
jgi:Tol biopolymer transport system component